MIIDDAVHVAMKGLSRVEDAIAALLTIAR